MNSVPPSSPAPSAARIGLFTAVAILVTNMIGTGVFTSLGFQLAGIESPSAILLLWLLGGVTALCGAAVYGELGVVFPRSGGEYNYLSRTYHPLPGFLAGWLSATVGFAAPVALSAKAFGAYLGKVFPQIHPTAAACACILAVAAIHAAGVREGSLFQNLVTAVELLVIVLLIGFGLGTASPQPLVLSANGHRLEPRVETGRVFVDGKGVGDIGEMEEDMIRPCVCGIVNQERAPRIFRRLAATSG